MAAPQPPKRKPLGKAIQWSDADLAALSEITPQDIAAAKEHWRTAADPHYADLLDATLEEPA